jgi:hypothetical protein
VTSFRFSSGRRPADLETSTPYQLPFYENEYRYRSVLARREACGADPALLGTKATITGRASSSRGRSLGFLDVSLTPSSAVVGGLAERLDLDCFHGDTVPQTAGLLRTWLEERRLDGCRLFDLY